MARIHSLVLIGGVLGCTVVASAADQSAAGISSAASLSSDIAAQPLADALSEFARQTGLQLGYVSEIAQARRSKGARAGQPPADALNRLLEGTGLRFEFLNPRTVRIFE